MAVSVCVVFICVHVCVHYSASLGLWGVTGLRYIKYIYINTREKYDGGVGGRLYTFEPGAAEKFYRRWILRWQREKEILQRTGAVQTLVGGGRPATGRVI